MKQGGKAAIASFERLCRTCGRWSTVPDLHYRCPHCGEKYGRVAMGLDVPKFRGQHQKLPKPVPGQYEAAKVGRPKPGEFGA